MVVSDPELETKLSLVASEFYCACEKCGKTPLLDCSCDLPNGAMEVKSFIQGNLLKGMSVQEVIRLTEMIFGFRISGSK